MSKSRILIVSPAYNEERVIPSFIKRFLELRHELRASAELRLLVVDDGSHDRTLELLRSHAAEQRGCVSYLALTANFGYQAALVAGLLHAGSWPEAIVTMDSDLEHPLELIPKLLGPWRDEGCMVVDAIRKPSAKLGLSKRFFSSAFYRVTSCLTRLPLRPGQADFRLWDAATVRRLSDYLPRTGSLRVFAAWLPVRKGSVEFTQAVRRGRRSRFTFAKNWEMAMISIIRFSNAPLDAITVLGAIGLTFSAVYGAFILAQTLAGRTVSGWSSLILTVIIMSCLQLISLGILANYLRRLVFAKDLPLYLVKESSESQAERG